MKKWLSGLLIASMSLMVGCGTKVSSILTDFDLVTAENENQEQVVSMDFSLDLGSNQLPFAHYTLPENYGMVVLSQQDGKSHVSLQVNLTQVAKLPAGAGTLPNGTAVPVDTYGAGVIEIPIDQINGKVYVSFVNGQAVVGFGIALDVFDRIGDTIGDANAFPVFTIKNFTMSAGIFASSEPGKSGVAAFVANAIGWGGVLTNHHEDLLLSYKLKRRGEKKLGRVLSNMRNENNVLYPVLR